MKTPTKLETELKTFIIETLALEDLGPDDIPSDQALFGNPGLGLDSVDALELGVALQECYGVTIQSNSEENRLHFASIANLAKFVSENKKDQSPA